MTKIKSIISIQPLLSDNIITNNDFDKKLDKITSHHKANTLYKPEWLKYKEYAIANDLELFEIDSINKYLIRVKDIYKYNTMVKKRAILQRILRSILLSNQIELTKFPVIHDKKPKYVLSSEQFKKKTKEIKFPKLCFSKIID
jgi:hypothetical protein